MLHYLQMSNVAINENEEPLGLIEFLEETINTPQSVVRMDNLKNLITSKDKWKNTHRLKLDF